MGAVRRQGLFVAYARPLKAERERINHARRPRAHSYKRQDLSRLGAVAEKSRASRRAVWEDLWDREVVAYAVHASATRWASRCMTSRANEAHGVVPVTKVEASRTRHVAAYACALLVSAYAFAKAVSSPYVGFYQLNLGRPFSLH